MAKKWLLIGIIVLAFFLRVVSLDKYPVGLNPDEASFGYDAYSLLQTGRDQWGHTWPLSLESFGDYKLPLYSYLAIPSVAILGLNEFSTRLPNAIFGVLAVYATYLMVLEIFKDKKIALASCLILAISPWHVMLSRGAFEANLSTFFMPFGVWLFLKGLSNPKLMFLSAVVFGLNLFSYHSARLVTPLVVLLLVVIYKKNISFKKYFIPAFIFLAFCFIALWTMINGGATRGADIAIFNPTDKGQAIFDRRYEATVLGMSDQISRIFSNKITFTTDAFIKNFATYFSPQFLFLEGPLEKTYGMIPGIGVLYLIEVITILTAVVLLIKNNEWEKFSFLFFWLLIGTIPATLAKGGGFAANREAIVMPVWQIISAYGLLYWWETYKKFRILILSSFVISVIFVAESYLYHSPINSASSMMYGRRELVETLKTLDPQYNQILVSRSLSEPHIYFAFYNQWDPQDYQNQTLDWQRYKIEGRSFLDQLGEYKLGKYTFTSIDYTNGSKLSNTLLVGLPNEFPKNVQTLKSINYPDGKPAILIVDPGKATYALR